LIFFNLTTKFFFYSSGERNHYSSISQSHWRECWKANYHHLKSINPHRHYWKISTLFSSVFFTHLLLLWLCLIRHVVMVCCLNLSYLSTWKSWFTSDVYFSISLHYYFFMNDESKIVYLFDVFIFPVEKIIFFFTFFHHSGGIIQNIVTCTEYVHKVLLIIIQMWMTEWTIWDFLIIFRTIV
jgi:hypothetical protein